MMAFLYQSGEGPSKQVRDSGFYELVLVGEIKRRVFRDRNGPGGGRRSRLVGRDIWEWAGEGHQRLQIHRVVDGKIVEVWSLYATDVDWSQ